MSGQGVTFEWYGLDVTKSIEAELARRLEDAAHDVAEETRRLLNGAVTSAGQSRSRPGEPPHRDSGALERSIVVESAGPLEQTVGSDLDYAGWLETGTNRMAARPFLTRAFEESLNRICDRVVARID